MPSMVRPDDKIKKLAYKLLGNPDMRDQKKKKRSKNKMRLEFEEQIRVR